MNTEEIKYFNLLKEQVIHHFVQDNAVSNPNCSAWNGHDIALFQEDFTHKVKSSFSEKWFYTYFKNDVKKLPRIDMLNLLSAYCGYQNFADFKVKNTLQELSQENSTTDKPGNDKVSYHKNKYGLIALLGLMLLGLTYIGWQRMYPTEHHFSFCFVEKSNQQPPRTPLRITILLDNESPLELTTDKRACFDYTTTENYIKFVVQSPFHEPDTIIRQIKNQPNETISLRSNDYALMLQYYTSADVKDWKQKRNRLDNIIANDAKIYRIYPHNGIAIYTKKEFINQMTIPTETLDNIQILETKYQQNQIVKLKFTVTE